MIIGIPEIGLQKIVIDILNCRFNFDMIDIHRLQLKHDQRSGGILLEDLVNPQAYFASGIHLSGEEMGFNEFMGYIHGFK